MRNEDGQVLSDFCSEFQSDKSLQGFAPPFLIPHFSFLIN